MARKTWDRRQLVTGLLILATSFGAVSAEAQTGLPPEKGGTTYSLGMPPVYKGHAGTTLGIFDPGDFGELNALFAFGLRRDLGSPVVGLAALGLEGYAGLRGDEADGGGRALFMIPALHFTIGADYNVPDEQLDLLLRLELPIRRSGILGRGTQLRFDPIFVSTAV